MEFPKEIKTYCPYCNAHTVHKVKLYKKKPARGLAWGTRHDIHRYKTGYGGKSRFVALVRKQNKKPTLVLECTVCHKKHYMVIPKRMKQLQLV